MTEEKATAEDVVHYLKNGGFEVYLGKDEYHKETAAQFAPWEVVTDMNGEDLARWYEENQPKRALEALRTENPALYAQVADDKAKHEALQEKGREIYRNNSSGDDRRWYEDSRKCSKLFAEYAAQHPTEEAASMRYRQFEAEAAIAFRPKDYPQDRHWRSEMGNGLISYGLFRNNDTGEYLATMNDKRQDFALPLQRYEDREGEGIIAHKIIDGTGRTPESVLEEARWLWADHLLPLLRYTPIKNRTHIKAMEEAERLRTIFGSAAAKGDGTSAKPLRLVFEFFPAFRRAYAGQGGFYRALNDVFGEAGNSKQLMDLGVPYCGAPYGGDEENAKFGVGGAHFAALYADMNDDDRQDFREAFNEFAKILPRLNKVNSKLAHNVSQDLSWIAITMRHGAGARKAANFLDVMVKVQEEFRAMTENRPVKKWIRANKSAAPQW